MRKDDIPLLDKAINEVVMGAIREIRVPRDMIGGHEQVIDLPRFFSHDCNKEAFIKRVVAYLNDKKLFCIYSDETRVFLVTINFAVCTMTPYQQAAYNQKLHVTH